MPPFSLTAPRYDQSTYAGRLQHFVEMTDMRSLLTTDAQLQQAVARLNEFGAWIQACYGQDASAGTKSPVGVASGSSLAGTSIKVDLSASADRLVLMEDLTHGQRIRSFTITDAAGEPIYNGSSLGHKHIALLNTSATGSMTVAISAAGGPDGVSPKLVRAAAYSGDGC